MAASFSPRSSGGSSRDVVQMAKELNAINMLAGTSKGRLKYSTGWDKAPHSFIKLINEVQQQQDATKNRVLENVYSITVKEKNNDAFVPEDLEDQSSTSSSIANEFFNNDYYESSESSSQSVTPIPSPGGRRSLKRVTFADAPDSSKFKSSMDATMEDLNVSSSASIHGPGQAEIINKSLLGNILVRGPGMREDEYNDKQLAQGFLEESGVYRELKQGIHDINQKYNLELELRSARRSMKIQVERENRHAQLEQESSEIQREADIKRLRQQQKLRKSIEDNKKQMEAFKAKQKIEREKTELLKKAQEVERKKILEDFKRKEEELAAAAAHAEQERLDREQKVREEDEERRKKAVEAAAAIEAATRAKKAEADQKAAEEAKAKAQQKGCEVPPEFFGCILPSDLQRYLKSQQLLSDYKEKFAHISATSTKEYYSAALKAVNTTLNSIANSPEHIKSKADQLTKLLQGNAVYLGDSSGTSFTATSQAQGELFVSNLLAFRFVKKSESEISKGHTSVEPLATLGVMVAQQFPDWAILVRANFYKLCPFLVPFSFPRNDKSIEDYAVTMGHALGGSESAVRQALLDRLTGYCTLYTMMVKLFERRKIVDIGETTEFFSLREVWRILSATMKLKPQLDMTATVIQILLENLGGRLSAVYGTQFKKLVQFLLSSYLGDIRRETPSGKTAALTRLELFLETKLQTGF